MIFLAGALTGYSSFASPGTGGAIFVKFSGAKLYHNTFTGNWVTAGGNEASIGGAVAGKLVEFCFLMLHFFNVQCERFPLSLLLLIRPPPLPNSIFAFPHISVFRIFLCISTEAWSNYGTLPFFGELCVR
jgi:hypothetical protein